MEKKRYIEYDIMRILACLCVIMIHTAVFDQSELWSYDTLKGQAIRIWGVLARWAVPCFVMLSGMMILPKADSTSIKKLMISRVFRMLGAYIAWSCVYSFYNTYILGIVYSTSKLKTFIDGCFSGEIHMWYLPMLAGLYLVSPLLAILIKNLNSKWTLFWLISLFIFSSIIPFIKLLNIKFISTVVASITGYMDLQFLGGWTLYFVLGYFVQKHEFSRRERTVVYIVAACGFVFTFFATIIYCLMTGEPMGVLSYEYPNIYIYSVGILLLFKEKVSKLKISPRFEKAIYAVSKLTFGIYLIHVLLLKIWYVAGVNLQIAHPLISVPVVSVVVFISGAAIIWCIRKIPVVGTYFA